jgi:hypothetical protein
MEANVRGGVDKAVCNTGDGSSHRRRHRHDSCYGSMLHDSDSAVPGEYIPYLRASKGGTSVEHQVSISRRGDAKGSS